MTFDICVYTKRKPIIDQFLIDRFGIEFNGAECKLTDIEVANTEDSYVMWNESEDFVNLKIGKESCPEFYPRYNWERKVNDIERCKQNLPQDIFEQSCRENFGYLIANMNLWEKINSVVIESPKVYKRIFGVLEWAKGKPTYHIEMYTHSIKGLKNAAGLAKQLADNFDGLIWDPINHQFGYPNIKDMINNCKPSNLFIQYWLKNDYSPNLRLVK